MGAYQVVSAVRDTSGGLLMLGLLDRKPPSPGQGTKMCCLRTAQGDEMLFDASQVRQVQAALDRILEAMGGHPE